MFFSLLRSMIYDSSALSQLIVCIVSLITHSPPLVALCRSARLPLSLSLFVHHLLNEVVNEKEGQRNSLCLRRCGSAHHSLSRGLGHE
jgi:hypothetical protein